jgi:hypothetical protein
MQNNAGMLRIRPIVNWPTFGFAELYRRMKRPPSTFSGDSGVISKTFLRQVKRREMLQASGGMGFTTVGRLVIGS